MDTDDSMADVEENAAAAIDELEFDISDTGAIEEPAAAEDEFSLDIDASELDIDTLEEADNVTDEGEASIDLGDVDLGLDEEKSDTSGDEVTEVGDVDIDFGLEEESVREDSASADEEISLDLTEDAALLDMDLGEEKPDTEEPVAEEPVLEEQASESEPVAESIADDIASVEVDSEQADDDDFDLSSLDDVDEISTKLDLARAYLDMGDHEGTRGILEEVIADGNDEQKKEAADLMAKLD